MALTREQLARDRMAKAITAGKLIRAPQCERCGKKTKTEGHHHDYDKPLDAQWLCKKCHMEVDGRLDAIHAVDRHKPPKPCTNCARPSKPLRKGRCHACNQYYSRCGVERPYAENGRKEKVAHLHAAPCLRCGRRADVVGNPVRGYCKSCYTWTLRHVAETRRLAQQALGQLSLLGD